jgi:guanine deaminase
MTQPNETDHTAKYLEQAVELATRNVSEGGGPFGALVVTADGRVHEGVNRVTRDNDPTAHAEVVAIRAATAATANYDLQGAVLYASCEPCPMCFGAAWWARIERIVFAATREDAAAAGFDDAAIHADVATPPAERVLLTEHLDLPESGDPFAIWEANPTRTPY